jgi:hypothetical protein
MRLLSIIVALAHGIDIARCPFDRALQISCHPSNVSFNGTAFGDQLGQYAACASTGNGEDYRLRIGHADDDLDSMCTLWDGQSFADEVSFDEDCLEMRDGKMTGQVHVMKMINDNEMAIDQPVEFSCAPSVLQLHSSSYDLNRKNGTRREKLHREITAPHGSIIIYDLLTDEEATTITRGFGYRAVVSLGDKLYHGYEMNVDKCQVGDEGSMFEVLIKDRLCTLSFVSSSLRK